MTYLFNDPAAFVSEAVTGLALSHPDHLVTVHGGVVRSTETPKGQPALVIGGGSGHYPAFAGWVGPGMGHGAPCGNIFASPSASQVYSVARNANNGGGVILGFGNYAGDVLHFGLAAEKLRAEGVDVRTVRVTDDIASGAADQHHDRRGIAGDLPVFKILGGAIEAGADIDEAERIALKANEATRSFGVAFDGCTLPGSEDPLFRVDRGRMGVGLGIHGEPGIRDAPVGTASEVAELLVEGVLTERQRVESGCQGRAAVIVNGLGTVKYEEQFVVYSKVAELLEQHDVIPVRPEVGEFVTSLDMAGLSLTLVFLDQELEKHWQAPVDTPAYRRGAMPALERRPRTEFWEPGADPVPKASHESREIAKRISAVLDLFERVCAREEDELGRIDAVAGDGDHGQGMVYGSAGAAEAVRKAVEEGAGARTVLVRAGDAWSESAGGTAGALWGSALTAAGGQYTDSAGAGSRTLIDALDAGIDAVLRLGCAKQGDKTMIDAAIPFRKALADAFNGNNAAEAVSSAAKVAREAADGTANITALLGRARVLGDKSLGTPDPGAISFAILMTELGRHLT